MCVWSWKTFPHVWLIRSKRWKRTTHDSMSNTLSINGTRGGDMAFTSELRLWVELLHESCVGPLYMGATYSNNSLWLCLNASLTTDLLEEQLIKTPSFHIEASHHNIITCSITILPTRSLMPHVCCGIFSPSRLLISFISRGSKLIWLLMCLFSCLRKTPICCPPISLAVFQSLAPWQSGDH